MSIPPFPFVEYGGRVYLVVNFSLPPIDDMPSLQDQLATLLRHHPPGDIMLLRPLTRAETNLFRECRRDSDVEAWARMIVSGEDLFCERGKLIDADHRGD